MAINFPSTNLYNGYIHVVGDVTFTYNLAKTLWEPSTAAPIIHDTPVDGSSTIAISSNWAFDSVKTIVPENALFTDTESGIFAQGSDGHVTGPTAADVTANKILQANNSWVAKPTNGTDGNGISGSNYDAGTGKITLTFDDTTTTTTGDLRRTVGAIASGSNDIVSSGTLYTAFAGKASTSEFGGGAKGLVPDGTSAGTDKILQSNGDWIVKPTNGTNGLGWTGGSYASATGKITLTSNDGLGVVTDDLRGASTVATTLANGLMSTTHVGNLNSAVTHYGTTHAPNVTFTTNTSGFVTGPTAADILANKILQANNSWVAKPTNGTDGNGITGSSYNASDGTITLTFDDTTTTTTGDLRRTVGAIASGSNDIVSSGVLYTAFAGKSPEGHTHSEYAASSHGIHVPSSTTQGDVLTAGSTAGSLEWAAPASGGSGITTGKAIAMAIVFG
jgi:hypothetical protein